MGILFRLLALPVTAPTNGLISIFRLIQEEVEQEQNNPEALQAKLIELQRMLENGDIDETVYEVLEEDILDKLEAIYDAMEQADE